MSDILNKLTKQITENQILPADQMTAGFDEMMEGKASPVQMAAFLIALKMRGEAPSDIAAGAGSLRRHALTQVLVEKSNSGPNRAETEPLCSRAAHVICCGPATPITIVQDCDHCMAVLQSRRGINCVDRGKAEEIQVTDKR